MALINPFDEIDLVALELSISEATKRDKVLEVEPINPGCVGTWQAPCAQNATGDRMDPYYASMARFILKASKKEGVWCLTNHTAQQRATFAKEGQGCHTTPRPNRRRRSLYE